MFSSHILNDVQEVCDHVAVIHDGRLAFQGTLAGLVRERDGPVYLVHVRDAARKVAAVLEGRSWVRSTEVIDDDHLRATATSVEEIERLLPAALVESAARVVAVAPETRSLERIFLELTT